MSEVTLTLLPTAPLGAVASRTARDRLEILTALIDAPSFDPLFRPDALAFPGDHPVYGWYCTVPACDRSKRAGGDFCSVHHDEWKQMRARDEVADIGEFLRSAGRLRAVSLRHGAAACVICPDLPAATEKKLCRLHAARWRKDSSTHRGANGRELDFEDWAGALTPHPCAGTCQVVACPETAEHPVGLCWRHLTVYKQARKPGGAMVRTSRGRWVEGADGVVTVSYENEILFRRWCREAGSVNRGDGKLSLLGLKPLLKAEIKWSMFHHTQVPGGGGDWAVAWIQALVAHCRAEHLASLADLDLSACNNQARLIGRGMLRYLELAYFDRQDTKEAGYVETDHFGVRFRKGGSRIDLTDVTQRWLRDLLWDSITTRLATDPPRSKFPFDTARRGCIELSVYLEASAPQGGHSPSLLTAEHAVGFAADQRHRAAEGLPSLGIRRSAGPRSSAACWQQPSIVTPTTMAYVFNGTRQILRGALESGQADKIGLDRGFVVTLPPGRARKLRRRPFPDDAVRALTLETNLQALERLDPEDRGLRNIWEAIAVTGRRCGEILALRLECIGRLNGLPMLWYDATKVGNYDHAIRIPERLYELFETRQTKTVARFAQRMGRAPTAQERLQIALFPGQRTNRKLVKGISYGWLHTLFREWVDTLDIAHCVPHQARHTLATKLLQAGASMTQIRQYMGHVSEAMSEHYTHLVSTDPGLENALQTIWVGGPGSAAPGALLSGGKPMSAEEAQVLAINLTRASTPADGGFCTFQPVVDGSACPWQLNCHGCDKFVLSGADLVYWHRKREQWRMLAERAPDPATADYLHEVFEPTARAIDGLEKALAAAGLLEDALALDLRRPQDYFGRVWTTAFKARDLAGREEDGEAA